MMLVVYRAFSGSGTSAQRFGIDALDRLTSENTTGRTNGWSYDLAGNRTLATHNGATNNYTLGVGDRLSSTSDGHTYLYNAAGCVTNISSVSSVPSVATLSWNSQYQLTAAHTNGILAESYTYDSLNRRVSTTTYPLPLGEGQGEGETTFHVYDNNWQVLADLAADGTPLRSYTWAPGIDNLLAMTVYGPTATNTYSALTDHLGTVHALADATGAIVESYDYDAWGNVLAVNDASGSPINNRQSAINNRYLFQGREYSFATGLYHFRHRWHDPVTSRWLSNDPIGISGGMNRYVFCGNNPVNFVDPMGTLTWRQVGYFAAGVAVGAIVTAAIVAAAPVAVAALVTAGLSATAASATVTTVLGIGGAVGLVATGVNTYQNASAGNWDAVAYSAGTLVGGLGYGVAGGGRALAGLNGKPSSVPRSWNPFADYDMGYQLDYPGGSIAGWLGSAPSPSSGGLSAAGVASGVGTIPAWFTGPPQPGGTQQNSSPNCP